MPVSLFSFLFPRFFMISQNLVCFPDKRRLIAQNYFYMILTLFPEFFCNNTEFCLIILEFNPDYFYTILIYSCDYYSNFHCQYPFVGLSRLCKVFREQKRLLMMILRSKFKSRPKECLATRNFAISC